MENILYLRIYFCFKKMPVNHFSNRGSLEIVTRLGKQHDFCFMKGDWRCKHYRIGNNLVFYVLFLAIIIGF